MRFSNHMSSCRQRHKKLDTQISHLSMSSRGGRGRGGYYREVYGGRGRGSKSNGAFAKNSDVYSQKKTRTVRGTSEDLARSLQNLHMRPYPAYHDIEGMWAFPTFNFYLDHAQADPYAAPSKARVRISHEHAGFPPSVLESRIRRTALADYILRRLHKVCQERKYDQKLKGGGWAGAKGGQLEVDAPGQYVLERTAVIVDKEGIEMRFLVGLPAQGRSILGHLAAVVICEHVPEMVECGLLYASYDTRALERHVLIIEDQHVLRTKLKEHGLVAFVPNGAKLARASGDSDLPMTSCVPFQSPPSVQVSIDIPNRGSIQGMGLKRGSLNVCIGGGFHGKSTFLSAMALGSYNFVPDDGREFVCTCEDVASVRSEDGRCVGKVDISPFISNLPNAANTTMFSTTNASGSTSCAASLMESLELGADLLVLDEDTTASNFLVRDYAMQLLVPNEPITPLVTRARALVNTTGASILLVCGSSSSFLYEADVVLQMDRYVMKDVTQRAKELCQSINVNSVPTSDPSSFSNSRKRMVGFPLPQVRTTTQHRHLIQFGDHALDLSSTPQLVHKSQTRAIETILRRWMSASPASLCTIVDQLYDDMEKSGLDALQERTTDGFLARPRRLDIGVALNRLRSAAWYLK